jgi:hypothetical protein
MKQEIIGMVSKKLDEMEILEKHIEWKTLQKIEDRFLNNYGKYIKNSNETVRVSNGKTNSSR